MNKTDFIDKMMEICPLEKKEVKQFVDLFIQTILENIDKDEIVFSGFGKFEKCTKKIGSSISNLNGAVIQEREYQTIKFTPSIKIRQ